MVYESDFYTTRRPYSRPLTSYSVTVSILRVWLLFLRQESGLEVCLNNVFATRDELTSRKRESPVCERKCTIPRNRQTKQPPMISLDRADVSPASLDALTFSSRVHWALIRFCSGFWYSKCFVDPKRRSIDITRRDFQWKDFQMKRGSRSNVLEYAILSIRHEKNRSREK